MKIAFPHMGNACIPLRGLVEYLGAEAVVPERPHRGTLDRGVRHAPEFVCLPFKITLGDCMNALDNGAEVLAMVCGMWACRFGYYGQVQHMILKDLGYHFDSLRIGREDPRVIWEKFSRYLGKSVLLKAPGALAMLRAKAVAVEEMESIARKVRPREARKGDADALLERYLEELDAASTLRRVRELREESREALRSVPLRGEEDIVRVRIVGELYVLLEPSLNFDLVRRLGTHLGVEAQPVLSTYRWLLSPLWLDPFLHLHSSRFRRLTRSYLPYILGGEEHMTIGGTLDAKRDGYDGVIHAYPLTCMPENICRTILPHICNGGDIPLLDLCYDEHTSPVGTATRLEAFVDMPRSRKGNGDAILSRHTSLSGQPCCL